MTTQTLALVATAPIPAPRTRSRRCDCGDPTVDGTYCRDCLADFRAEDTHRALVVSGGVSWPDYMRTEGRLTWPS